MVKGAILGVEGSNCDVERFERHFGATVQNFETRKMVTFGRFFWIHCFLPKKQRVSVCESFLGRFGPYFRVTAPGGVL